MTLKNNFINHAWLSVSGLIILATGISMVKTADLGFAPFDTFISVVMEYFNFNSFGDVVFWVQMIIFIFLLLNKKRFGITITEYLTSLIAITLLSEAIIYASDILLTLNIEPNISYFVGGILISLGLYFVTRSNKIVAPLDKLLVSISTITNKPYSSIKLTMDISLTSISIIFIIIFGLNVPITLYSLFITVVIGYIIKFFEKVINIQI